MKDNWPSILKACRTGNLLAQQQLYEHYQQDVFVHCLRYANDRVEAQYLLEEVFFEILKNLPKLPNVDALNQWINQSTLKVILRYVKSHTFIFPALETDDTYQQLSYPTKLEEHPAQMLIVLFMQLPIGYRTLLNLYLIDGYSFSQIAEEFHLSVRMVRLQFQKGKSYLKQLLDKSLTS